MYQQSDTLTSPAAQMRSSLNESAEFTSITITPSHPSLDPSNIDDNDENHSSNDIDNDSDSDTSFHCFSGLSITDHKNLALNLSLAINFVILITKGCAFAISGSLSVLAALMDSILDILSQFVLYWAEKKSTNHSVALYPAGASRLEPVGVIICAALMGMGSFQVIKEAVQTFINYAMDGDRPVIDGGILTVLSMIAVIFVKIGLYVYCKWVAHLLRKRGRMDSLSSVEAMYQDHFNDALSNTLAVVAVTLAQVHQQLWWIDPLGALSISFYILYSWYNTGLSEIEKIAGRAAEQVFIDKLLAMSDVHHPLMTVDVCRCYHFGPKFLVEMEVVLPPDMILKETHDIGMDLQYRIEKMPEIERAFVHIDYAKRGYDEHANSRKYISYQHQVSADNLVGYGKESLSLNETQFV